MIGNDFFVFRKFALPTTFFLHSLPYRCSGVPDHVLVLVDGNWLVLLPVKNAVDLQLLQTRCVVIQLGMKRSRRVPVVSTLMAVLAT